MKRHSLYRKLYIYFLVVIVLSLTSVGIFTYRISTKELDVLEQNQMTQIVNNAVHHTDLYLLSYERSIVSLLSNGPIKEFLDLPPKPDEYDFYYSRRLIKETVADPLFIRSPDIASLYVISFNGNAVYYYNGISEVTFSPEETKQQLQFFWERTQSDGQLKILINSIIPEQQNQMLTLVRQIRGATSITPKGLLGIEIRSADLSALWKGIDLGRNGYFFIVDDNGQIVYHPDSQKVRTTISNSLSESIRKAGDGMFESEEGDERRMYMARKSDYAGWHLVVTTPVKDLRKPIANIRSTLLIVGLFTLLFALGLAYRFGRSITGPIQVLKNGMRQTEKGNWATIPLPDYSDEIVELMTRYNLMVNRLQELIEQVYETELRHQESQLERQKAEFQSLQLQINPHFLYNSLETIICYGFVQDSEEITEIVKALAFMLRYSVQTNLEETTVVDELKHVMYYLVVLHHRIGREFELDVSVNPDYLLHKMVRLTLQPIVENVFQHAFADGVEDFHFIRVDAGKENGLFWVSVEDNGCGMTEEQLAAVRERLDTNRLTDDQAGQKGGIGMLNVHRRIQMVFGNEYGLRIESKLDQGTKVTMVMPDVS